MAIKSESAVKIKAVVIDYGEVLCHRPPAADFDRLAKVFGLDGRTFQGLWDKNRGAFDRGDMGAEEYWVELAKDAHVTLDPAQLTEACEWDVEMWGNENPQMVAWLKRLRRAGIRTAILSNIHPRMIAHVRKHFDWLELLDFTTFSAEVRMIKPEPAIYEHTLRGLGVEPEEALFIADKEINVQAARDLGMHGLRFLSVSQLRQDLQAMGFPILPALARTARTR